MAHLVWLDSVVRHGQSENYTYVSVIISQCLHFFFFFPGILDSILYTQFAIEIRILNILRIPFFNRFPRIFACFYTLLSFAFVIL